MTATAIEKPRRASTDLRRQVGRFGLPILVAVIAGVTGLIEPRFWSASNLQNLARQLAPQPGAVADVGVERAASEEVIFFGDLVPAAGGPVRGGDGSARGDWFARPRRDCRTREPWREIRLIGPRVATHRRRQARA